MAIGHTPIRDRLVLPRREGAPLAHVFTGADTFPADTEAYLYIYDALEEVVAFWPLEITGADVTLDVEDWWPYKDTARSFTVFIIYPTSPSKFWPWFEGSIVRPL